MSSSGTRITRADIESKLNELKGDVDDGVDSARGIAVAAVAGVVVLVVVGAFLAGRRKGRKRTAILEIRRI